MWSTRGEEARLVCNQTLNGYHAGRRPPERRQGRAACPTASSPSACCSRPGCLYPERQKTSWFPVNSGLSFFLLFLARDGILRDGIQILPAHTVIMMQGDSFAQKSSSSSLWNVASFSTIRTNLAEEAISAHWLRSAQRQPSTNNDTQVDVLKYKELRGKTRDISDPANVWRDSNCLKWQRCVVSKHSITEPIFATQYKQIQDCDSVDFM